MAGVNELAEYVAKLSQAAQLDSSGQFTLDLARGLAQLSKLAWAYPNRWAYYLTQAGVAGGARAIHLSSGLRAESVTLEFAELPEELVDSRNVTRPESGQSSACLQLLRQGLRWVLATESPLDLVVESPRGGYCLSGQKSGYQLRELAGSQQTRVGLVRGRPAEPWWKKPFGRARSAASLMLESRWRLAYCPVPVKIDGFSLCSGVPDYLPDFHKPLMMQQLHLLPSDNSQSLATSHPGLTPAYRYLVDEQVEERPKAASPVAEVGWLELVIPGGGQLNRATGVNRPEECMVGNWYQGAEPNYLTISCGHEAQMAEYSKQRCRCSAALYYCARSRDVLHCQRYGMLCDPIPLPGLQTDAWNVVWADDTVQVDPSGQKPILDEYLNLHIERLQQGIRQSQIRVAAKNRKR